MTAAHPARTAITNARVFDGHQLSPPRTVVLDGSAISADTSAHGAAVIDAAGGVLLPGLIDAHIHVHAAENLQQLASWGVTTGLDMMCLPPALLEGLRAAAGSGGLADLRSAGTPAIGADGPHAQIPGMAADAVVRSAQDAEAFVAARCAQGSDYLKIVAEAPGRGGPDQPAIDALVAAAHTRGLRVVVHALTADAFAMALHAGADVITHTPLDRPLPGADVARMAAQGCVAVPTLSTMESASARPGASSTAARRTVTALHRAGVTVLAGTDAITAPAVPFHVEHGVSLHTELESLVAAGLSPVQALHAATAAPARVFGLSDRGAVRPGLRADLVLLDGDPVADIRATRAIRAVWCAGQRTPDLATATTATGAS